MSSKKITRTHELVAEYLQSRDYDRVGASAKQYRYWLNTLMEVEMGDGTLVGDTFFRTLTPVQAQSVYDLLTDRGPVFANRIIATASKVFSFGIKYGYLTKNPWSMVDRLQEEPRKVTWSRENVMQFLEYAYSNFDTRSIGLIAHMAYDWAQRIGDMRMLTWDDVDLDRGVLNLTQSKRRATVHLPISDDLLEVLKQQHKDFGWQKYVAPNIHSRDANGYRPFSMEGVSRNGRKAITRAGLPDELRLSDLRRTATTEMVEAGVGLAQVMQVTGHKNPQSVKPYMKNTLSGASNALKLRGLTDDDSESKLRLSSTAGVHL